MFWQGSVRVNSISARLPHSQCTYYESSPSGLWFKSRDGCLAWSAHLGCHRFFQGHFHGRGLIGGCDATLSGGDRANCIIVLKKEGGPIHMTVTWQSHISGVYPHKRTRLCPHLVGVDICCSLRDHMHPTHSWRLYRHTNNRIYLTLVSSEGHPFRQWKWPDKLLHHSSSPLTSSMVFLSICELIIHSLSTTSLLVNAYSPPVTPKASDSATASCTVRSCDMQHLSPCNQLPMPTMMWGRT